MQLPLVIGPAPAGAAPDIDILQTYASGPMSEVDSIIWPNPAFDNNVTVYGPEVRALAGRYLKQMIGELRDLPHPDGDSGSLLDAVDLIVPHQANQTMVVKLAQAAGVSADRLYFNIARVGNTSAASIPLALHDAVCDGVIDRQLRVFAPGFGAGAVAGYAILSFDPAVVANGHRQLNAGARLDRGQDLADAGHRRLLCSHDDLVPGPHAAPARASRRRSTASLPQHRLRSPRHIPSLTNPVSAWASAHHQWAANCGSSLEETPSARRRSPCHCRSAKILTHTPVRPRS